MKVFSIVIVGAFAGALFEGITHSFKAGIIACITAIVILELVWPVSSARKEEV